MHYLIYKITNKINNIIYVGKHMTNNIDDNYMGSGVRLKEAIESFGIEHFTKEILFECESEEAMNQKEAEIVDEVFVARLDTYNISLGGDGGWDYSHNKLKTDPQYAKEFCQKVRNGLALYYSTHPHSWTGKKHTTESKVAIGRKNSVHQKGSGNSHYGKIWIYNLELKESISIKPEELPKYQAEGWIKGRRMKFLTIFT